MKYKRLVVAGRCTVFWFKASYCQSRSSKRHSIIFQRLIIKVGSLLLLKWQGLFKPLCNHFLLFCTFKFDFLVATQISIRMSRSVPHIALLKATLKLMPWTVFENHRKCRICVLQFLNFPPFFQLKLTCLVTLFDRKLQVFKNSPKLAIFMNFGPLKM